jgi:glycosyltransferase involved in cell wall biosynthesis
MTSARVHGAMALAMLRIEDSHFGKELDKLIDWLATDKPDILCLGTALQAGMIRQLKQRLGVKIICCFQGEDSFLDGLPEPFKSACWSELRSRLAEADLLVAPSQFYADLMRQRLDAPGLHIEVMPNGIDLEGYHPPNPSSPPVIGYLARMIREKGLAELVEAFIHLRTTLKHPDARLHIAGAATAGDSALIGELKQQLDRRRTQRSGHLVAEHFPRGKGGYALLADDFLRPRDLSGSLRALPVGSPGQRRARRPTQRLLVS